MQRQEYVKLPDGRYVIQYVDHGKRSPRPVNRSAQGSKKQPSTGLLEPSTGLLDRE